MNKKIILFIAQICLILFNPIASKEYSPDESSTMLHFINTGSSDAILIESNGHYGLIDTGNPYQYIKNEVEHVNIDESKGERNQWTSDPDASVQAVIDYLNYMKVKKLEFILGTHAHSDHIGGVPAIAYYYVDSNTKYYYREYRKTREDTTQVDWANYKYYLAAVNSMQKKSAQLFDLTNKHHEFDFGDLHLEFLNTDIDPDELNLGENQNSIITLNHFRNTKILLAADMIAKDDQKIKDYIGKLDLLKLAHHGYSESSYDFLKTTKPDNVVILNDHIPFYCNQLLNYLKYSVKSKVYMTKNISKSSKSVPNSAIKLKLNLNTPEYELINTGSEVEPDSTANGWSSWYDHWTYIESGKTVKKWQKLKWSGGEDWFYFNEDGLMLIGWQELEWTGGKNWFYFDKNNGNMLTGWQELEWTGGKNWFYFYPENGTMVQDCCIEIDGKQYCFDENGCLIE